MSSADQLIDTRNELTGNSNYVLTQMKSYTSFNLCSRCFHCDALHTVNMIIKNYKTHWNIGLYQQQVCVKTWLFILLLFQWVLMTWKCISLFNWSNESHMTVALRTTSLYLSRNTTDMLWWNNIIIEWGFVYYCYYCTYSTYLNKMYCYARTC